MWFFKGSDKFRMPPLVARGFLPFEDADIIFSSSQVALVQELGITHFVYSTYWVNTGTVPLITAIQMQQAWSRANHAALLASNIGYGYEDSGSGVYVAGRAIKHIFLPRLNQTGDNLLVAPVPKQLSTQGGAKRLEYGHLSSLQGTGDDTPSVPSNATLVLLSDAFTSVSALYTSWDGHRVSCHLEAEFLQVTQQHRIVVLISPWNSDSLKQYSPFLLPSPFFSL